ncbi:MarP family serine protease [Oryzobacter telluris]|uniref:MarP family serine protease n=1 Tax=Oryzobacter telluris TaxID=3149179 RepID=UPI00370D8B77
MTGSTVLDLALLVVLVGYAATGWRQGVVAAVLGLVGLVGGAFLAIRYAPELLEDHAGVEVGTTAGALALVGSVFIGAAVGQALLLVVGRRLREAVQAPVARALDSFLGLVAVLCAAVLVVWVVAGAVRHGGPPQLRSLVARSTVVTTIDKVVPSSAGRLVDGVTKALDAGGFPRVFEGLGPEPIPPVAAPDRALVDDPDIDKALGSVIHVRADSGSCDRAQVGSGWVVGPGRVATNAHVVAGADQVTVSVKGTGRDRAARVVAFDPRRDVAVLEVPGLPSPALSRGRELGPGDPAVIAGFPGDAGLTVRSARVRATLTAQGADIYGRQGVTREIYSLRAVVRSGASGGPVFDPDGEVVGMVFATSLDDPDTGYALTLDEIRPVLQRGLSASSAVSTGPCAEG